MRLSGDGGRRGSNKRIGGARLVHGAPRIDRASEHLPCYTPRSVVIASEKPRGDGCSGCANRFRSNPGKNVALRWRADSFHFVPFVAIRSTNHPHTWNGMKQESAPAILLPSSAHPRRPGVSADSGALPLALAPRIGARARSSVALWRMLLCCRPLVALIEHPAQSIAGAPAPATLICGDR